MNDLTKKRSSAKAPAPPNPRAEGRSARRLDDKALHWRCLGPASMSGVASTRPSSVLDSDPSDVGIRLTAFGRFSSETNNGQTFRGIIDHEGDVSIPAIVCGSAHRTKNHRWGRAPAKGKTPQTRFSYGRRACPKIETDGRCQRPWKNMGTEGTDLQDWQSSGSFEESRRRIRRRRSARLYGTKEGAPRPSKRRNPILGG